MTITDIKQLIDIVLDSSRNGYFPELVINGETYDVWIKGLVYFPESKQPGGVKKGVKRCSIIKSD